MSEHWMRDRIAISCCITNYPKSLRHGITMLAVSDHFCRLGIQAQFGSEVLSCDRRQSGPHQLGLSPQAPVNLRVHPQPAHTWLALAPLQWAVGLSSQSGGLLHPGSDLGKNEVDVAVFSDPAWEVTHVASAAVWFIRRD